jgi:hypothetical protein
MIPNVLTFLIWGATMSLRDKNLVKKIESKHEVMTYLERLHYALKSGKADIRFQRKRMSDENKDERYTNRFTFLNLFQDEDEVDVLKRELARLGYQDYIETVKDSDFPERSDWRVFGKKYSCQDVYIKIRVELLNVKGNGKHNSIFVMSFHFAEYDFSEHDFPYRKNGGK